MENTTLYRKYRPQNFSQLYGQQHIVKAIKNSLDNDKMAHAYLFNGPRGVGKTTIARLIAKGVNCEKGQNSEPCEECENCVEITKGISTDLIEIDAASNRGIDEIRELKESTGYLPIKSPKKIYIIDEVHMLTKEAFNALLKILEEPPSHVIFILATTEIEKIPDTVISRCQRYDFKTITEKDIVAMLRDVATKENITIDDESLELIYQKSEGSARDSFSIFEQVVSNYYNEDITIELTEKALGLVSKVYYNNFLDLIQEEKKEELISFIDNLWNDGIQIDVFLKDFCKFVKKQSIDLDLKIKIISNILELLFKFKNEEDKKLISYLIIDKILKKTVKQHVNVVPVQTHISSSSSNFTNEDWETFKEYLHDINKLNYYNILANTSIRVFENEITISFPQEEAHKAKIINESIKKDLRRELSTRFDINLKINLEYVPNENDLRYEKLKSNILELVNAVKK